MGKNTRYDALVARLRQSYSRSATFTNSEIAVGGSELILDVDDPEFRGNDSFLEFGPYNFVSVKNTSGEPIKVYVQSNREAFVTVAGATNSPQQISDQIPARYVGYLRVENDGTGAIAADDIEIQVGQKVDSVEMDLLKMSGLLNLEMSATESN